MSAQPVDDPGAQDLALAAVMHLARRRPLTIADVADLDPAIGRVELIDGMLILTPNPDFEHQELCVDITFRLNGMVPSGRRAYSTVNIFEPGTNRLNFIPDVVVVDRSKIVNIHGRGEGVFPTPSSWSSRSPHRIAKWILG